jgi:protein NrfD
MTGFVSSPPVPNDRTTHIPTYGGRPALKPSVYKWLVAAYMAVAGVAGSSQILATLIELMRVPNADILVLAGRVIAIAGAITGGVLLIVELYTPKRFYNMLRIFRPTSPMSIGSYLLTSFGFFSVLALAAQVLGFVLTATVFGSIASLSGLGLAVYPAALLAATSTPLWAAAPRTLAIRFAASSMASGAALLCMIALWPAGQLQAAEWLGAFVATALAVELAASLVLRLFWRQEMVDGALLGSHGLLHLLGGQVLGSAVPILLFAAYFALLAHPELLLGAALMTLTGTLLMRASVLLAGNESAENPVEYFHFTRPERS